VAKARHIPENYLNRREMKRLEKATQKTLSLDRFVVDEDPLCQLKFVENIFQVVINAILGNVKDIADFFVCESFGQKLEDFFLSGVELRVLGSFKPLRAWSANARRILAAVTPEIAACPWTASGSVSIDFTGLKFMSR
jgi:hypothetical protein